MIRVSKNIITCMVAAFSLISCSTSTNGNEEPNIIFANDVSTLNSYDFFALGKRGITLNELEEAIDGECTYLFEFKGIDKIYCAYLPTDLINNNIDKKYINNPFYLDCIDGKNYYNNPDSALWIEQENDDKLLRQFEHRGKTYALDLVMVSKTIHYFYDFSNNREIDKSVDVLIRSIYKINEGKLEIKKIDNPVLGINQYNTEYYLSNCNNKYLGYGKIENDLSAINQAIEERHLFDINSKDGIEYVMYHLGVVCTEEDAKAIAGKYYESLKNDYIIENDSIGFKLSSLLELK